MNIKLLLSKINIANQNYPQLVFTRENSIYTCINPYSYHIFRKNKELYDEMTGVFVDGILMCKLIHLFWGLKIRRLSFDMSSMANDLFTYLNEIDSSKTIYFIGTKQEFLVKSIEHFKKNFPNIKISGFRNGYFKDDEEKKQVYTEIINSQSDFVVIGMGAPLQEQFVLGLKNSGYKGIIFTCGGFLHQSSKRLKYYPKWINKYNLRAFYRLFNEKGLWSRLYNVLIQFPMLFIWDTITSKLNHSTEYPII